MVNVLAIPVQLTPALAKFGTMLIVAITGIVPELVAINEGIVAPVELPNPILGSVFVHE